MITVTLLGFDQVLASALTGINDLLSLAGVSWNKIHGKPIEPRFKVQIASWDKKPIRTLNNLYILPHCAIQDIKHSDVYLVPCINGDIESILKQNPGIINLLKSLKDSTSIIAGNCTGSFFLGEAGLLDNKVATTHWAFAKYFKKKYPQATLQTERPLTQDGNILCDHGGQAWFDLGLYLIELFCDHETAVGSAKSFVINSNRSAQLHYSPLMSKKHHNDQAISTIQDWMQHNYATEFTLEELALNHGLSNRSLIRRFQNAIDQSPSDYLQEVRLDVATKMLVQTNKTIDEITHAVGYQDSSSFSKLFKRRLNLSPSSYRSRFKPMY